MPTMSQVLQLLSMLYSDFLLYVKNNKKVHVECVCFWLISNCISSANIISIEVKYNFNNDII